MSYSEKIKSMQWSFSRLSSFEQCKYCFYLQYILTKQEREQQSHISESNYWAENGSVVHETLEKIFRGEITVDEAGDYYREHYKSDICYEQKQNTMERTFESCANYFDDVDFSWLKGYEILGVELEANLQIGEYKFIGYIDLLLRRKDNGKIILIDHKSGEYFFRKDGTVKQSMLHTFEKYKKQMYLYCNAVKELYGEFPAIIVWNHFKDGGKFSKIPFQQEEYDAAMEWFFDAIKQIEQEEDFEPSMDYFYCVNLCSFRHSCEYRKDAYRQKSEY